MMGVHMASRRLRCGQHGYLMEVPIILAVTLITLAVFLPMLPPIGRKIAMVVAALPVLYCLYYMIVTPGWRPNPTRWLTPLLRMIIFALVTVAVVTSVVIYVIA